MNVTLKNTSRFGFWVTLSDGKSIDLSPRTKPVSVPERELRVNSALKKLIERGLIENIEKPTRTKQAKVSPKNPEKKAGKKTPATKTGKSAQPEKK